MDVTILITAAVGLVFLLAGVTSGALLGLTMGYMAGIERRTNVNVFMGGDDDDDDDDFDCCPVHCPESPATNFRDN